MPAVSKAQNAAMRAAMAGKSTLGIPKEVGRDFVEATPPGAVKRLPERVAKAMKEAGCRLLIVGYESGDPQILKNIKKGANVEMAQRFTDNCRKLDIKIHGDFIIGLPGETETTIRQTIDFAKRLPLDIALFHIAAPYPGTPFFHEVVKNRWFRPGTRWEEVDMDESTEIGRAHV